MARRGGRRPDAGHAALIVSLLALFAALGGPTLAATSVRTVLRAVSADKVDGLHASKKPKPHTLLALDGRAKLPLSVLPTNLLTPGLRGPAGPQGPAGEKGAKGDKGDKGDPGTLAAPEAYRMVGSGGQPAFENGWNNTGVPGQGDVAFSKDPLGVVRLAGMAFGGATNATVFTLPEGYRPAASLCEATTRAAVLTEICVGADGHVTEVGGIETGVLFLDGITFRAAA